MLRAVILPPFFIQKSKNCRLFFCSWSFSGEYPMSGLDNLIAFIDNGGTRSGSERRHFCEIEYMPERRTRYDRRSGADRRRSLNKKRKKGKERRTVFVD